MSNILDDINLLFEIDISGIDKKKAAYVAGGGALGIGAVNSFYNHLMDSGVNKNEISSNYISNFNKIEAFYNHNYNFFKRNLNVADTDISRLRDAFIERDPKAAQRLLEDLDVENFPNNNTESFESVLKDLTDISLSAQYGSINTKSLQDFFGNGGIFTQDFNNPEIKKLVMERASSKIFNSDLDNTEIANMLNLLPENRVSIGYFRENYGIDISQELSESDISSSLNKFRRSLFEDNEILKYLDFSSKEQIIDNRNSIFSKLRQLDNDDQRLEVLKVLDKNDISFDDSLSDYSSFDDITVLTDNLDGFSSRNIDEIVNNITFTMPLETQIDSPITLLESLSSLKEYPESLGGIIKQKINNYDQHNDLIEYLSNSEINESNKNFVIDAMFSNGNLNNSLNLSDDNLRYLISEYSDVETFRNYITNSPPPDISSENLGLIISNFDNLQDIDFSGISSDRLLDAYNGLSDKSGYDDIISDVILTKINKQSDPEIINKFMDTFDSNQIEKLYGELEIGFFQDNPELLQKLLENSSSELMSDISNNLDLNQLQHIDFSEIGSEKANSIFNELNDPTNFEKIFNNPEKYKSFISSLNEENIKDYFDGLDKERLFEYFSSKKFLNLPDDTRTVVSEQFGNSDLLPENIDINTITEISKIKSEEIKEELFSSIRLKVEESDNEELVSKFNEFAEDLGFDKINTFFNDVKDLLFNNYGLASIVLATGVGLVTAGLFYRNKKQKIQKSVFKISKYYKIEEEFVYLISDVYYDFSNFFKKKIRNEKKYKYELYEKFNTFKDYLNSHQNKNKIISDIESDKFFKPLNEYFYDKKRTSDINLVIAKNIKTSTNYNSFNNEFFVDENIFELIS